ncbi:Rubredoxin [Gracilariopsis chorda]|uniref:Rubredoxin n=1 Tax=Gracilariopsis chorda TaxID=448386 RepID=A0A2V3IE15_9FLOR|nr:Rubredoxin [Gracilariopsis chorda]|eukprot:PXF40326.1 Rubredoxin [Gracilariopsis chorda]
MAFIPTSTFTPLRSSFHSTTTKRRPIHYATSTPTPSHHSIHLCEKTPENQEQSVSLSDLNKLRATPSEQPEQPSSTAAPPQPIEAEQQQQDETTKKQEEIERLRAAEKFITVDEGRYECPACGYTYEPKQGEKQAGIQPGTPFEQLPATYFCPVCRTPKSRFISKKKVIAGFADNQSYGFGTNSMTAGQKNLLIFGGLVFAALLLLSGYGLN